MFLHTETVVVFGTLLPRNFGYPSGCPVSINVTEPLSHFAGSWLIKKFSQRLGVSDLYKTDSKTEEQLSVIQAKLKIYF